MGVSAAGIAVRPFAGKGGMNWVMSTIGFGVILQSVGLAIWGPAPVMVPFPLGDDVLRIAGAGVRPQELLVLACAILIMIALDLVMRRTRIGKAMMAVAHSPQTASLMGINVNLVMIGAFALSSGLAGVAGVLWFPYMIAFPVEVLTGSITTGPELLRGFGWQCFWLAVWIGAYRLVWTQGRKRYGAVGG